MTDDLDKWAADTAEMIILGLLREEGWVLPDCTSDEEITTRRLAASLKEIVLKRISK